MDLAAEVLSVQSTWNQPGLRAHDAGFLTSLLRTQHKDLSSQFGKVGGAEDLELPRHG